MTAVSNTTFRAAEETPSEEARLKTWMESRPAVRSDPRQDASRFMNELFDLVVRHFCLYHHACLKDLREEFERQLVGHVLETTRWNQRRAARILGVKYTTLNHKIFKLGLNAPLQESESGPASTSGAEQHRA
jgi:transcriptional regulator with GAF, ATPase, and Fis domain